ncbi:hypothetical protein Xcel_2407 [Xylanimonas cellulosilytica DSM 15894]|uniref:Methionine synthase vitamin-B12 independent n=1 Tax=Xylanimonas cellulosilytica (strain DSM 15894 / JCM 12276 / CECT 5975 / KCTC 9989 / LMG 20990 / NBRC 107835 / XIL07) TaxID=446471 RepID=D1BVV3_XYLCX|nr:hypothetical protein [Xylanimonas cellulosilytica]ACZ31422.1 hypothetical protein Xcel_2407 [Xylanimonas cellulosilytica DSM 15894]
MTAVSGHGPWPGDERDELEAQLTVLGDLAELPTGVAAVPFLTQLVGRGPGADAVGRTAALLADLPVELGPHGWKLADHPGLDLRRADTFLREDLGALAIAAHGYDGTLAVEVVGPWTLAATLWSARGDRVLADAGARRELAESLGEGIRVHVAALREQVPGISGVVVQLAEPRLGAVHAGVLPTFSGYTRLRAVPGPDLVDGLRPVLDAVHDAGADAVVHLGDTWAGIAPAVLAGADAVGLDLGTLGSPGAPGWDERAWELVARATEKGVSLWAGLPPAQVSQCAGPMLGELVRTVAEPWRRIGLPASGLDTVTLLASPRRTLASTDAHRAELANLGRIAEALAERAAA